MAMTPKKRTSAFAGVSGALLPEDLENIDTIESIDAGITQEDLAAFNQGTVDGVQGIGFLTDSQIQLAKSQAEIEAARLNSNFAFTMEDLARAKEQGGNAINTNALQRGVFNSGFIKDDRAKFNEEIASREAQLEIGLGFDQAAAAASLKQLLLSLSINGILDTSSLTLEDLGFVQNLVGQYGGNAENFVHPDGYSGQNGAIPVSQLQPIDDKGNMLTPSAASAWEKLVADAAKDGITFSLNNAYRSYDQQAELYANRHNNPNPVAPPGSSNHGWGLAVDINGLTYSSPQYLWLAQNAAKYGFFTIPNDLPHWEYRGGGVVSAGSSGSSSVSPSNNSVITAPSGTVPTIAGAL